MPHYLYRVQPTRIGMVTDESTPEEERAISELFKRLQLLMEQGVVLLAGRSLNNDENTFAMVIFKADSDEAAREIMNEDPAVKAGVLRAELFPFFVAMISEENADY